MYKININIFNDHGDLLDKQFTFNTLDEMKNLDVNKLVDEAEKYGEETGMVGAFDSKEEAELNKEDIN